MWKISFMSCDCQLVHWLLDISTTYKSESDFKDKPELVEEVINLIVGEDCLCHVCRDDHCLMREQMICHHHVCNGGIGNIIIKSFLDHGFVNEGDEALRKNIMNNNTNGVGDKIDYFVQNHNVRNKDSESLSRLMMIKLRDCNHHVKDLEVSDVEVLCFLHERASRDVSSVSDQQDDKKHHSVNDEKLRLKTNDKKIDDSLLSLARIIIFLLRFSNSSLLDRRCSMDPSKMTTMIESNLSLSRKISNSPRGNETADIQLENPWDDKDNETVSKKSASWNLCRPYGSEIMSEKIVNHHSENSGISKADLRVANAVTFTDILKHFGVKCRQGVKENAERNCQNPKMSNTLDKNQEDYVLHNDISLTMDAKLSLEEDNNMDNQDKFCKHETKSCDEKEIERGFCDEGIPCKDRKSCDEFSYESMKSLLSQGIFIPEWFSPVQCKTEEQRAKSEVESVDENDPKKLINPSTPDPQVPQNESDPLQSDADQLKRSITNLCRLDPSEMRKENNGYHEYFDVSDVSAVQVQMSLSNNLDKSEEHYDLYEEDISPKMSPYVMLDEGQWMETGIIFSKSETLGVDLLEEIFSLNESLLNCIELIDMSEPKRADQDQPKQPHRHRYQPKYIYRRQHYKSKYSRPRSHHGHKPGTMSDPRSIDKGKPKTCIFHPLRLCRKLLKIKVNDEDQLRTNFYHRRPHLQRRRITRVEPRSVGADQLGKSNSCPFTACLQVLRPELEPTQDDEDQQKKYSQHMHRSLPLLSRTRLNPRSVDEDHPKKNILPCKLSADIVREYSEKIEHFDVSDSQKVYQDDTGGDEYSKEKLCLKSSEDDSLWSSEYTAAEDNLHWKFDKRQKANKWANPNIESLSCSDSKCLRTLSKDYSQPCSCLECLSLDLLKRPLRFQIHQTLMTYPVHRGGSSSFSARNADLIRLMNYEVFRLSSFSYSDFPRAQDVWVTQLARSGFFFVSASGRVQCFSCGRETSRQELRTSLEDVHDAACQRSRLNRPLQDSMEGLSQQELNTYFHWYGTLRPNEVQLQLASSVSEQSGQFSSGYISGSDQSSAEGGEDSADAGCFSEPTVTLAIGPDNKPSVTPAVDSRMAHSQSLPGNLNDMSGAVVSEESFSPAENPQVLTSVTRIPVAVEVSARQAGRSGGTDADRESRSGQLGAVGGHTPAVYDLTKASYPQFATSEARRSTFANWDANHTHKPEDLISAGFFYAGYQDCVRCFYCGLGLKYWRTSDIPAYQHARFRPNCVYNLILKGQDYIDRVQQDVQTDQVPGAANDASSLPAAATFVRDETRERQSGTQTGDRAGMVQTLLEGGWTRDTIRRAMDHVERAFGAENLLLELVEDVLATQVFGEVENLPPVTGTNVGSIEGSDVTDTQAHDSFDSPSDGHLSGGSPAAAAAAPDEERPRVPLVQQPAIPELKPEEQYQLAMQENRYLTERMTCLTCKKEPVSCVYLPCGHVIACSDCADLATHCKLCGAVILGTANIYLA